MEIFFVHAKYKEYQIKLNECTSYVVKEKRNALTTLSKCTQGVENKSRDNLVK